MSFAGTFVLAVSLSMDSFTAALGGGAHVRRGGLVWMARTAAVFAAFEVAALSLGWVVGYAALSVIAAVDHWIAFAILAVIGGRMIFDGVTRNGKAPASAKTAAPAARSAISLHLVGTAFATSIDAAAVGITTAFLGYGYLTVAPMLGGVVFVMSCIGTALGRRAGPALGRWAEMAGGTLLIGVGVRILIEHLYF